MNRFTRRVSEAMLPIALTVVLTACGSSVSDTATATEATASTAGSTNSLAEGPQSPGEHGPLSASDSNDDGTERRIGLVAFFDENDTNGDEVIDADELADVEPSFAFNGTDANADEVVSRAEVVDYVNEISPAEIEVAHGSGQLERG